MTISCQAPHGRRTAPPRAAKRRLYVAVLWRLVLVLFCLGSAYVLVQQPHIRTQYASWDKAAHAAAFGMTYLGLAWALRWHPLALFLLAAALGAAVEVHQLFLPGFTPSLADWIADVAGIFPLAALHMTCLSARRKGEANS